MRERQRMIIYISASERERETDREKERERETDREKERKREIERERERNI